ncbi:hypothetical protein RDABS01_022251 [Bienertia sinuspersici]
MHQKVVSKTQVKLDFWKQQAKGRWLEMADTNTKFFYRRAQSKKKRNELLLLQTQEGIWVQSKTEIHALLVNHFKGILGGATGIDYHNDWQAPEPDYVTLLKLAPNQGQRLVAPITHDEVRRAVFQMGLMFSPNTLPELRLDCKNALGTRVTNAVGKYLGSQIDVSGKSLTSFGDVVTKLRKKLFSWEHLYLSPAGRILFANAILATLSINILYVFLMPKYISKEQNSIICKIWWNGVSRGKPIYWWSRYLLEQPKMVGGLGLRNVQYFNEALLVKQAWRLHNHPSLMLAKVYTSNYKMSPIAYGIWGNLKGRMSWSFRGLVRSTRACRQGFGMAVCPTTNI